VGTAALELSRAEAKKAEPAPLDFRPLFVWTVGGDQLTPCVSDSATELLTLSLMGYLLFALPPGNFPVPILRELDGNALKNPGE
jgi:hypothetical protein